MPNIRRVLVTGASGLLGINLALEHAIARHNLPETLLEDICLIANVFVHPAASIRQKLWPSWPALPGPPSPTPPL